MIPTDLISQIQHVSLLKSAAVDRSVAVTGPAQPGPLSAPHASSSSAGTAGTAPRRRAGRAHHRPRAACRARRSRASWSASQTTWSGMSVTCTGSVIVPASVLTASGSPSATPTAAAVTADTRATGPLGGPREVRLAVLQPTGVEQLVPRREHRVTRRAPPGGSPGASSGAADARAVPAAELVELGVHVGDRVETEVDAERVGERVQHAVVGQGVRDEHLRERPRSPLPGDERAGLLDRRRDGQHHVGPVGDLRRAHLERDDEAARCRARRARARGSGRSAGSTPPTTSPPSSPVARGGDDLDADAARRGRQRRRRPRRRRGRRGPPASATGRPPGSSVGSVPASTAPRSPARRGTHATRAPVRSASRSTAVSAPADGRGALADEDHGARRRPSACAVAPSTSARHRPRWRRAPRARCPGRRQRACRPGARARGSRARRPRRPSCGPSTTDVAQPQEEDAALLLGLVARRSSTAGAAMRSANVTSSVRPATWWPRNAVSSAECGRARWSTSLVPSADAGELRVRVGVLERHAAAGQHAHAAAVAGRAQALGRGTVAPRSSARAAARRACRRAAGRRTSGVAMRSGDGLPAEPEPVLVGDPLLVDRRVVAGEPPHARRRGGGRRGSRSRASRAPRPTRSRHQVERSRAEPVRRRRQCADRADLHGVAREVRRERPTARVERRRAHGRVAREAEHLRVERADLLLRPALLQVDPHVARDLLGEPRAALAQDAPLTVEQDLRRDRDRLGERALDVDEPGWWRARCSSPGSAGGTRRPCRRPGSRAGG